MTGVTLKKLASLSQDLNKASDALSQQIAQVESALNELKLGISASVELYRYEVDVGSGHRLDQVESVGYGKHNGKWCLLYRSEIPDLGDDDESVVPLREAPRTDRIAAVDKLPKLVEALEASAIEMTERAKAKAVEVANFAAALKESA